jgi:hypothetical protein
MEPPDQVAGASSTAAPAEVSTKVLSQYDWIWKKEKRTSPSSPLKRVSTFHHSDICLLVVSMLLTMSGSFYSGVK